MKKILLSLGLLFVMQPLLFANYGVGRTDMSDFILDSGTIHLQLNDHEARLDNVDLSSAADHTQLNAHELNITNNTNAIAAVALSTGTRQFSLSLSTPVVGNIITRVAKSSYTLTEVCAYAGVPPAGADMTITVTTGTSSGNASWLTGTALGTLTIVDGKIQSNTLTPNQYIAKDSGMVRIAVTQIGSTANNTGFDVCITASTRW